jgi:hypothetical protein
METEQASRQSNKLLLVALFLFLFAVPVLVLGPVLSSVYIDSESPSHDLFAKSFDIEPIEVDDRGGFIKVSKASDIAPRAGQDFFVVSWFNLKSLPSKGGRMFMLSHLKERRSSTKGFGLALSRSSKEWMRPEVYLSFDGKSGGWFRFQDIKFIPGQWFMFAVSFYEGKYLGAFIGTYDSRGKVNIQRGGGYEINLPWKRYKTGTLRVGAIESDSFRGFIGPFGVFSAKNIKTNLNDILKSIMLEPSEVPSYFNDEDTLVWSPDGRVDLGPLAHEMKLVEGAKRSPRKRIK